MAAPMQVFELFKVGVTAEGIQPHQTGNFFLGQRTDVPGLLHYPVAIALRLTPLTMLGVLLLPVVWRQPVVRPARPTLLLLIVFVVLFVLAMSYSLSSSTATSCPCFPCWMCWRRRAGAACSPVQPSVCARRPPA